MRYQYLTTYDDDCDPDDAVPEGEPGELGDPLLGSLLGEGKAPEPTPSVGGVVGLASVGWPLSPEADAPEASEEPCVGMAVGDTDIVGVSCRALAATDWSLRVPVSVECSIPK